VREDEARRRREEKEEEWAEGRDGGWREDQKRSSKAHRGAIGSAERLPEGGNFFRTDQKILVPGKKGDPRQIELRACDSKGKRGGGGVTFFGSLPLIHHHLSLPISLFHSLASTMSNQPVQKQGEQSQGFSFRSDPLLLLRQDIALIIQNARFLPNILLPLYTPNQLPSAKLAVARDPLNLLAIINQILLFLASLVAFNGAWILFAVGTPGLLVGLGFVDGLYTSSSRSGLLREQETSLLSSSLLRIRIGRGRRAGTTRLG